MTKEKPSLVLIGPREGVDGKIGGMVVLFENLLQNLSTNQVKIRIVDSNACNYANSWIMFFNCIKNILRVGSYSHISLHGTAKD